MRDLYGKDLVEERFRSRYEAEGGRSQALGVESRTNFFQLLLGF